MLPTTSYLPTVHYVQLLPVLGYLLLVLCFLFCDFFVLISTYGTLCSMSNGTRYLLPTTYCVVCDFFGVKSKTPFTLTVIGRLMRALTCLTSFSAVYFFFEKQMARPSYLLNHSPITNLVCIKYGYGKYTIIIIIIIIITYLRYIVFNF